MSGTCEAKKLVHPKDLPIYDTVQDAPAPVVGCLSSQPGFPQAWHVAASQEGLMASSFSSAASLRISAP